MFLKKMLVISKISPKVLKPPLEGGKSQHIALAFVVGFFLLLRHERFSSSFEATNQSRSLSVAHKKRISNALPRTGLTPSL